MITKEDIKRDLIALGLKRGDLVLVHSALASIGKVDGGADTVIDALLEVLGPEGTLMMPTLYYTGIYKRDESPSLVGTITEVFRKRPGVLRSIHATHSVAAQGPLAEQLIADHDKSPTACGLDTPYGRNATLGGYILLLGCDQDRNTTLHTVEEYADAPWLTNKEARYYDADGVLRSTVIAKYPGPHRDFIGLDRRFREKGIETIGKVGNAVCRLMKAQTMINEALQAFREDPAAVLCDNPNCADCTMQRGKLKAHRLASEDFTLSTILNDPDPDYSMWASLLQTEGISRIEIGPALGARLLAKRPDAVAAQMRNAGLCVASLDAGVGEIALEDDFDYHLQLVERALVLAKALGCEALKAHGFRADRGSGEEGIKLAADRIRKIASMAEAAGVALLLENAPGTCADNLAHCEELIAMVASPNLRVAFNPGNFAAMGENPFLKVYYHGKMKRVIGQLVINDGLWDGTPQLPGRGNGETKELISILRCRSYSGLMTLAPAWEDPDAFKETAQAFWHLLDTM